MAPLAHDVIARLTTLLEHRRTGELENDAILDSLAGAIGDAAGRVGLVGYGDPAQEVDGGRVLRDTRVAPLWALAHAALYVGARLPGRKAGETEDEYLTRARDAVVYPLGIRRGTHEAVRRTLQPFLTGTKSVYIGEDPNDPYAIVVRTENTETPDPAAARQALEGSFVSGGVPGAIRAELVLQYVTSAFATWIEGTRTYAATAATVTWANVTREDVT